jgi:MscS family membrane protein
VPSPSLAIFESQPFRSFALASLVMLAMAASATHAEGQVATAPPPAAIETPLSPLDTSSPRATLKSFCNTLDRIYANLVAEEHTLALRLDTRRLIQQASTCLDTSTLPTSLAESEGRQALVCLKEVLDRIPLPPEGAIPDVAAAKADGLKRWRLPGTEIVLSRIVDGPREGDFVFSAETVVHAERFYDLVRLLPYRPDAGSPGLHDAYVTLGGWMISESFIRSLPAFAHARLLGETVWQWIATLLLVVASAAFVRQAWRLSRHHAAGRGGRDVVGKLLFPAALIAVSLGCDNLLTFQIRLTGDNLLTAKIALRVVTLSGTIAGVLVAMAWLCELVIRAQGMRPEGIDSHLLRLGGKVLTFIVVAWILLNAADSIGLPVTPLMAGLGAGGLAIALASQYTLENLIAGLVIFADKPVRIGDDCQFGSIRGRVEQIGLRSTRIRGEDRTLISVPNAEFAKQQLVNYTSRDNIPLKIPVTIAAGMPPRRVRELLTRLRQVLVDHPRLATKPVNARLTGQGPSAITVEVSAVVLTDDEQEYGAVREEVLLAIMETINACERAAADTGSGPRTLRAAA